MPCASKSQVGRKKQQTTGRKKRLPCCSTCGLRDIFPSAVEMAIASELPVTDPVTVTVGESAVIALTVAESAAAGPTVHEGVAAVRAGDAGSSDVGAG